MTASSSGLVQVETERSPAAAGSDSVARVEPGMPTLKAARRAAIDRFEVEYVRALLQKADGNVTRAATFAAVSRQVIHKLIAKHRI